MQQQNSDDCKGQGLEYQRKKRRGVQHEKPIDEKQAAIII